MCSDVIALCDSLCLGVINFDVKPDVNFDANSDVKSDVHFDVNSDVNFVWILDTNGGRNIFETPCRFSF